MIKYKPVSISKASFTFCRIASAVLVWLAFVFQSEYILMSVVLIFLLSAIFKVSSAPLIKLFDVTFNKVCQKNEIVVDERAIFFAHTLATILSLTCLILILTLNSAGKWYVVLAFALLKTLSAFGVCPASKLYSCTINGNCCVNKSSNEAS